MYVVHDVNMRNSLVPNKGEMRRYLSRGLTQAQIVDAWENDSGIRVSRSAIAMAIQRYGLESNRARPRYEDTLPWSIKPEHQNNHNARMLRLEGRRRRGLSLNDQEHRWLAAYKDKLKHAGAVVTYVPELDEGFVWVQRNEHDDPRDFIRRDLHNVPGGKKGTSRKVG